jgi:hypothetical protein
MESRRRTDWQDPSNQSMRSELLEWNGNPGRIIRGTRLAQLQYI